MAVTDELPGLVRAGYVSTGHSVGNHTMHGDRFNLIAPAFVMLVFGPLADIVKIEWLLLGAGICLVPAGVVMTADQRLRCAEGSCDPA